MKPAIKKDDNIVSLLIINKNDVNIPKPFELEIFLFETYIAGTTLIENIDVHARP